MNVSRHRGLRIVGWVAAYVVALHAILASFVAPASFAAAASGNSLLILCLTSDHGNADTGSTTTQDCGQHCAIAATGAGALPPPSAEPHYVAFAIDAALDAAPEGMPPRSVPAARPGNPRAPPSLA